MSKIALVTGSSRGIGKAIALALAKDGYDIIIHYRKEEDKAKNVAKEIETTGRKTYLVQGDIAKEADVKNIFAEVSKITDHLDILVNNAGFDYGLLIEDYTLDQMSEIVNLILIGRFATTKYALPLLKMSSYPSVINIASRMGREKTIATVGPYAAAEAGVIKFTQCCALEFKKYGIRVNCVAPGLTDTELTRNIIPDQSFWDLQAKNNPRGRVGSPQDIANVVSFLASEKSDYIDGETINVTGGSTLG